MNSRSRLRRYLWGLAIILSLVLGYCVYVRRSEELRERNNQSLLMKCSPAFRDRANALLRQLETAGYKPVIRETWRDIGEQVNDYKSGFSDVTYGRHNETDENGRPSASAMDIFPISHFSYRERRFELHIACLAARHDLETGIEWGLKPIRRLQVKEMLKTCVYKGGPLGWDPLHIQLKRESEGIPDASQDNQNGLISFVPNVSPKVSIQELMKGDPPLRGGITAPVKIVEFVDFDCPFCADFSNMLLLAINNNERGSIALVIRSYPLKMHATARQKAELSACIHHLDPEAYWSFFTYLFSNPDMSARESIEHFPTTLKRKQILSCLDNRDEAAEVDADISLGNHYGVLGTPTTFINGRRIYGVINPTALEAALSRR